MMQHLVSLLAENGLWLVFGWVLMERIGVPVPALPIMIVGGALVADGRMSLTLLCLVALAACLLGDGLWYAAGRRYGARVLRLLCRISLSPDSCVKQSESRFERAGGPLLVVAKFVPGLATMAAPVAGAIRLRAGIFFFYTGLGSLLWIAVGAGLGMMFHAEIQKLFARLEGLGHVAVPVLCALLAAYAGFKWWERRRLFKLLRMARISVDELWTLMQAGHQPVVVDVRSGVARKVDPRGIPGALPLEMERLGDQVQHLPRDREIILYCTCPNEESAAHVAKLLMNLGYTRVRPLHGGLDAWVDAGHQVEELGLPRGQQAQAAQALPAA
ncbi:MAG TPA: DedA family protein/thiosulfate sulfurtransferase GlpE [Burkholderiales bacterium]|nr:DedA family protein/thiosulfate sulfurtransferase GlpE [Burkholderiales bacterium]